MEIQGHPKQRKGRAGLSRQPEGPGVAVGLPSDPEGGLAVQALGRRTMGAVLGAGGGPAGEFPSSALVGPGNGMRWGGGAQAQSCCIAKCDRPHLPGSWPPDRRRSCGGGGPQGAVCGGCRARPCPARGRGLRGSLPGGGGGQQWQREAAPRRGRGAQPTLPG